MRRIAALVTVLTAAFLFPPVPAGAAEEDHSGFGKELFSGSGHPAFEDEVDIQAIITVEPSAGAPAPAAEEPVVVEDVPAEQPAEAPAPQDQD